MISPSSPSSSSPLPEGQLQIGAAPAAADIESDINTASDYLVELSLNDIGISIPTESYRLI